MGLVSQLILHAAGTHHYGPAAPANSEFFPLTPRGPIHTPRLVAREDCEMARCTAPVHDK